MYSVRLGFRAALKRIGALKRNKYNAEALVTSVFTLEKLMRRSLRLAMLARGFTSNQATRLIGRKGFKEIKEMWDIFDRQHRTLQLTIGNNEWQHVPKAVEMRNRLVHGQQVFKAQNCDAYTKHVLAALKKLHREIRSDYGTDPWTVLKARKKSKLQWLA
jgi:hypothetical protein